MSGIDSSHTEIDPPSFGEGDALDDPRVLAVVQEYMSELDQGRQPDRGRYVSRYPELAGAISQCLDGLDMVRGAGPRSSSAGTDRGGTSDPTPRALGDFQIVRELGRGGMGVVYEAVQLSLGRRVALKVLPFAATFDARQLQRFKNEAQAAALLHHTNIVPIYAVGCERGVHFYAMQLIEGHSLAVLIGQLREQAGLAMAGGNTKPGSRNAGSRGAENGSADVGGSFPATDTYLGSPPGTPDRTNVLPKRPAPSELLHSTAVASLTMTARSQRGGDNYFQKVVRLMIQAAEALEHAHQVGIVHRDIKPANLLVNTSGSLWVADFGLALFQADASLTRTGDLVGTFRYMSPEQATGQRTTVDHRTDIYSLGATFYELLTLEPVFAGETRHELLYEILHGEPKAPRHINRAIPVELETIVLKSLRKTPAERYASAAELADDLRRFLDNRPILARRPTPIDRARKWSRRHPSVVVATVLLLTVCLVALAISNRMIAQEQAKTAQRANEAEELFRQARQTVDVFVKVSEDELADNFYMAQTRKRLLLTALGFYQDLIEQRRGDAASQADLAATEQKVKGILRDLELLRRGMQTLLLHNPVVIRELRLNDEQNELIAGLMLQWDAEWQELHAELDGADEDSRRHRVAVVAENREQALNQVLDAKQMRRLAQLLMQWQGLSAFKEPDVVAALELTGDQRAAIRKIERAYFGKHPEQDRGPPGGPGPRREHGRHEAGRPDRRPPPPGESPDDRQAVSKVLELLNQDQIRRWNELTGVPVDGLHKPPFDGPPGPKPPRGEGPRHGGPPHGGLRHGRPRDEARLDDGRPDEGRPDESAAEEQEQPEQPGDEPEEK
ncbi:MAG TPA: serine/threonine-protein kinase [Pirellulales bacterium]|nr:serine/threonine-protein kinase [Pirellulales bacterium]